MKKTIIALIVMWGLMTSSVLLSQELKPIKQIFENGFANNDNAQIAYALKRCVSLNLVMGNWMEEKGGDGMKKAVENFFQQALHLKEMSFEYEIKIEKQRKTKVSTRDELEKNLLRNLNLISPLYIERLARNYASSGSYFENDNQLKEEISICADFAKYLRSLN